LPRRVAIQLLSLFFAACSLAAQAPSPPAAKFAIVLDAAHGGDDPGGRIGNLSEKAFTLAFNVRLRSLLSARGFQVVTTREQDAAMDSTRRAEIANRANAIACLSLHASESGSGVHLFVSSLTPAPPMRFPGWKTAQAAYATRSLALAGVLNSSLQQAGMTVTLGRTALMTVDSMACPAVAVEVAPERDAEHKITGELDSAEYQARVAEAIAAGLLEWRTEGRQP
jgi:N-acetylmuramoyl-L-alanine amidase